MVVRFTTAFLISLFVMGSNHFKSNASRDDPSGDNNARNRDRNPNSSSLPSPSHNNALGLVPNGSGDASEMRGDTTRQPTDLQGLLRLSVQAGDGGSSSLGSSFLTMDEERRKWLEEAIESMTTNITKVLVQAIFTLSKVSDLSVGDDYSPYEQAFDTICEYVDNLDIANDFQKIGGLSIVRNCLNSPVELIRWKAAELIAELSQNNPYCQGEILKEERLLECLLQMVDSDPEEQPRIKGLYAVSCLIRDNEECQKRFAALDGFSCLLRAMQSNISKLQIKSAFLLSSLCNNDPSIGRTLSSMGIIEQLLILIRQNWSQAGEDKSNPSESYTNEHLLSALLAIVREDEQAQREAWRPELGLRVLIDEIVQNLSGKEEHREELDYCQELLNVCSSSDDGNEDR